MKKNRFPIAVTIAGSDSSGGAGIQADLKTFSALGVYGASVLTALTAQNTRTVSRILDIPADFVAAQWDAVCSDLRIDAVKIGMLSQPAIIEAVAAELARRPDVPVVLDPVMVSKSGAPLLSPVAKLTLKQKLLPRAMVLTPNIPEAAALLELTADEILADPRAACVRLHELGAKSLVLKGGHAEGERSDDIFYDGKEFTTFFGERVATKNTHGTGCTFSAAIAAGLAHGMSLLGAVAAAKRYIGGAIRNADALQVGHGHGPVHHFFAQWE